MITLSLNATHDIFGPVDVKQALRAQIKRFGRRVKEMGERKEEYVLLGKEDWEDYYGKGKDSEA